MVENRFHHFGSNVEVSNATSAFNDEIVSPQLDAKNASTSPPSSATDPSSSCLESLSTSPTTSTSTSTTVEFCEDKESKTEAATVETRSKSLAAKDSLEPKKVAENASTTLNEPRAAQLSKSLTLDRNRSAATSSYCDSNNLTGSTSFGRNRPFTSNLASNNHWVHNNNNRGQYNPNYRGGGYKSSSQSNNAADMGDAFELDGQVKYKLKDPLMMPDFMFRTMSQVLKHQGHPWVHELQDFVHNYNDHLEGLSAELEAFYQYMKPREEEDVIRRGTYFAIARSIKKMQNLHIEIVRYYGSFSSGTYLPVSDIDIVVIARTDQVIEVLSWIATRLFADGIIHSNCQIITQSRIPLLKFYDSFTGFPINITVNTPHVMDRAMFIRENIRPDTPQIKLLYFLKFYLLQKNQNQVFHGGIGSYALSLMVIRYFQMAETKETTLKGSGSSMLARSLIGFLHFYGNTEFVRKHIISVTGKGAYIPLNQSANGQRYFNQQNNHNQVLYYSNGEPRRSSILMIEDHLDTHKNVSVGSYKAEAILNGFKILASQLTKRQEPNSRSIINNVMSVVDSFDSYRRIIQLQFEKYFKNRGNSFLRYDYDDYIHNRNVFGQRELWFTFDKLDDTSFDVRLMNQYHWSGQTMRACDSMATNSASTSLSDYNYSTLPVNSHVPPYVDYHYQYSDYEQHVTTAAEIFFQTLSQAIITARQEDMTKSRMIQPDYHHGGGSRAAGGAGGGGGQQNNFHYNRGYNNHGGGSVYYNSLPTKAYHNHHGGGNQHNIPSPFGRARFNNQYNNASFFNNHNNTPSFRRSDHHSLRDHSDPVDQSQQQQARRRIVKKSALNNNDTNYPNLESAALGLGADTERVAAGSDNGETKETDVRAEDRKKRKKNEEAGGASLNASNKCVPGKKSTAVQGHASSLSSLSLSSTSSLSQSTSYSTEERSVPKTAASVLKEILKIPPLPATMMNSSVSSVCK